MKLRSLVLFGAGIMTGLAVARKLTEDDPEVIHGPSRSDPSSTSPRIRIVTSQAQRLADRATVVSLGAIQRARGAIRDRLGEEPYDEVNWN
jgi:hypothetical protein